MIERVISHPTGRFTRCRSCGQEPHHIRATGRTSAEPLGFVTVPGADGQKGTLHYISSTRHSLECRCGARTARHSTVTAAETEWGTDYAQFALPLRLPRRRKVAA